MESIDGTIDDAPSSWHDIVLPLILGLAALVFFLRQRTITPNSSASSASLNDEERRKRRERMAAIAEERAMAIKRLQEADNVTALDSNNKIDNTGGSLEKNTKTSLRKTALLQSNGNGKDIIEGGKGEDAAEHAHVSVRKNDTEKQSVNEDEEVAHSKTMGLEAKEEDQPSIDERHSSVSHEGSIKDEKCEHENNSVGGDIVHRGDTDAAVEENANDGKEHDGNLGLDNEHEDDAESKLVNPMRGNSKDEGTKSEIDHRERHAKAIAKIMEKKGKQDTKKPAVPSLTIYLILTSSPGSPRLELSIPATHLSAASLIERVSKASGVANENLKLIFRGQIITEYSMVGCVIDEFKIENGSALHVMGKPQQEREDKDDGNADDDCSRNSGEEDSSSSSSSSSSESEDGNGSEEDALHFSDSRTRDQVSATIRSSSGEGFYHRAAQRGDLNALREAVNTGHSDFLHVADSNGWTPLHEAVRAGHVDVVEYLVHEGGLGADEVTNQGDGWTPLSLALEHHGRDHPVTAMLQIFLNQAEPSANNPWDDGTEEMYD